MKKLFFLLIAVLSTVAIIAQEKTEEFEYKSLFSGEGTVSHGGYGGFTSAYTQVAGRDAYLSGGKGAWILDHRFAIGGAGYGFNTLAKTDALLNNDYSFSGGYGGLLIEPIIFPGKAIHITIPVLVGAGGITYSQSNYYDEYWGEYYEDAQAYFVIEPGIEIEFNVVKYFRMAIWGAYRYTSDINLLYSATNAPITGTDKGMLRGFSAGLTFKFGKF